MWPGGWAAGRLGGWAGRRARFPCRLAGRLACSSRARWALGRALRQSWRCAACTACAAAPEHAHALAAPCPLPCAHCPGRPLPLRPARLACSMEFVAEQSKTTSDLQKARINALSCPFMRASASALPGRPAAASLQSSAPALPCTLHVCRCWWGELVVFTAVPAPLRAWLAGPGYQAHLPSTSLPASAPSLPAPQPT